MPRRHLLALAIAVPFCVGSAQAIDLRAGGQLNGGGAEVGADLSGLIGALENGVSRNLLGGLGSGLAWAGGNTLSTVRDRGPNATAYNGLVDDTTSYIARSSNLNNARLDPEAVRVSRDGRDSQTYAPMLAGLSVVGWFVSRRCRP